MAVSHGPLSLVQPSCRVRLQPEARCLRALSGWGSRSWYLRLRLDNPLEAQSSRSITRPSRTEKRFLCKQSDQLHPQPSG